MLKGSINHLALTVSDLDSALAFIAPLLKRLGYTPSAPMAYQGKRVAFHLHEDNDIAVNVWEATKAHAFDVYEPGLHHIAFNAASKREVDAIRDLVVDLGGVILDGPGEFPFAHGGYYAVYFTGPDNIKFEVVYMPELDDD